MTVMSRPVASHMTRDEFAVWDAPTRLRWQLVDGEPVEMAPASRFHGAIQAELARLIGNHLAGRGEGQVLAAPGVVPRVRAEQNFRIPDLGVTFEALGPASFIESPVLLAEILSPSNEMDTRMNVRAYTTLPSVQDILLLRSSRIEAELLRRNADGTWPADPVLLRAEAFLTLGSIGFTTPLTAVYRTTGLTRSAATFGVPPVRP